MQGLIVLWMTRSLTDDVPGWGALFNDRVGDGTVSVSIYILNRPHFQKSTLFFFKMEYVA